MAQDSSQDFEAWADHDVLVRDHAELRRRLAESSAANGWDEPEMDAYDSYPAVAGSPTR